MGSRHDNVKIAVERLTARLVIQFPPVGEKSSSQGRPGLEYLFQGNQGKRDSIIVVAQLSPEFTAALVDRWQELEAEVVKALLPQDDVVTMSSVEIAELTKKNHKNVMADIRTMLEALGIQSAEFSADYTDSRNRPMPCFHLPRDLTETLIESVRQNRRSSPLYVRKGYCITGIYATKELVYAYPL
ncbi:Rha family transcriptional regulator [Pseudomonas umsongensis]|uniref:Rha family transcriptional regulator n=1 Tax=Pseudomonas umsongensis TaxID=198618 RepID=UPI0032C1EE3E